MRDRTPWPAWLALLLAQVLALPLILPLTGLGREPAGTVAARPDASGPASLLATPLHPQRVIADGALFGEPVAMAAHQGRIYVLDAMEQVIWNIDQDTGEADVIELPTLHPHHVFIGCEGALHVVDPIARRLLIRKPDGAWRGHDLGYRAFYGAGDAEGIVYNADRQHEAHLATYAGCRRDTLRLGDRLRHDHPYPAVSNNLNYVRFALSPDLLVAGHIALGYLQVLTRDGAPLAEVDLTGPEVVAMRRLYLRSLGLAADGPLTVARDTLIGDLVRGARPERFPVPVYVADLAVAGDRIIVLVNNVLQVYSAAGSLVARHEVGGRSGGEPVVIHAVCVTTDGRLLGLDRMHYRKLYDFGPVAPLVTGPLWTEDERVDASSRRS